MANFIFYFFFTNVVPLSNLAYSLFFRVFHYCPARPVETACNTAFTALELYPLMKSIKQIILDFAPAFPYHTPTPPAGRRRKRRDRYTPFRTAAAFIFITYPYISKISGTVLYLVQEIINNWVGSSLAHAGISLNYS